MCQYSSEDGFANDWHLVHLGSRAVGGAAVVIQEATAVSPEGRISADDMGIWKDAHIEKLQQITRFIHSQDALAGIQLSHAGRKASTAVPWKSRSPLTPSTGGWQTLAPSPIGFNATDPTPAELTLDQIEAIVGAFREAARRAVEAGFDIIEIHGAHGYLIHQFLSPLSNQRKDNYGGEFDNRVRFLLEVIRAIRPETDERHSIWLRISATDWAKGGWDLDDSVRLAIRLQEEGIELIDTSTGGLVPGVKIPVAPGYQVPFAERLKEKSSLLIAAVGMITEPQQAENILQNGQADAIMMAREFLRDPYFPLHAQMELDADALYPLQYERAKKK